MGERMINGSRRGSARRATVASGALLGASRFSLLAGPTALAFFAGGYFDEPRAWAGLAAWILVAIALCAQPRAVPRGQGAWLAIGGLGLLAAWTLLSIMWAPLAGSAYHAGQIVVLYVGALVASALLLRSRGAQRAVEPALAGGTVLVIGYGLSERLLPGLLHFARSITADGRLEQPLSYWNAMGELGALGLVLCARLAGDATRSISMRAAAAATAAPLGLGLYVTFSRAALLACAAGLVALIVVAPRREQLRAIVVCVAAGGLAALAASPLRDVTALSGSQSTRETQGAGMLAVLLLVALAAGAAQWLSARRETAAVLRLPRRAPLIAVVVICAGLALAIVVGAKETSSQANLGSGASRLATLSSDRYAYWDVAFRAFAAQPVHGVGAGGWAVYWLRDRRIDGFAQDAHSLPIQTLAELGVVGLALLASFLAGIGLVAGKARRTAATLSAGPIGGLVVYIVHAPLDWDWQMPAVTLVALVLAGALIAISETNALESRPEMVKARDLVEAAPASR